MLSRHPQVSHVQSPTNLQEKSYINFTENGSIDAFAESSINKSVQDKIFSTTRENDSSVEQLNHDNFDVTFNMRYNNEQPLKENIV